MEPGACLCKGRIRLLVFSALIFGIDYIGMVLIYRNSCELDMHFDSVSLLNLITSCVVRTRQRPLHSITTRSSRLGCAHACSACCPSQPLTQLVRSKHCSGSKPILLCSFWRISATRRYRAGQFFKIRTVLLFSCTINN